jgi:hypothetical protein
MLSKLDRQQLLRRSLFTIALLVVLIGAGLLLNAVAAKRAADEYELASDFPRGALVYAQFSDLPAMLKSWDESELKNRYLASTSFQQLQSRHLALKLVSRWNEFNDATGFPIDAGVLGGLADDRAAIAVYDIGRLDLALIAPISEAKLAACRFFQGKDNFEEVELPDGSVYYLHDVEADRGRQKQQIGFAAIDGKLVLATNEKLLLRAIANLNGQAKKDRLTDEPSFQSLSRSLAPHFLTVWVDQSKLNDDWYFKHYWLMSKVSDLKNLRAGIFDLEMQQGRWIERREFLMAGKQAKFAPIVSAQLQQQIAAIVPSDVPFVQMRAAAGDQNSAAVLARESLFDGEAKSREKTRDWSWRRYDESDFEFSSEEEDGSDRYAYLSYRYNLEVDDPADAGEPEGNDDAKLRQAGDERALAGMRAALQSGRPAAAAKIAKPKAIEGPLFAEFGRAAILVLQAPASLDRARLEQAIAQLAANRLMIASTPARFEWRSRTERGVEWREMPLPALGRSVGYGLRGQMLILSNSPELLANLMTHQPQNRDHFTAAHELSIIRLNQRAEAFDRIFTKLDEPRVKAYWKERKGDKAEATDPSQEFFSGNIASLLDVVSPVVEVRVEQSQPDGRLREQVSLLIKLE